MNRIVSTSLALLIMVGTALWGTGLLQPAGVEASGHSATRAFASPWVAPGGQMQVTITAMDYGAFGQVVETLPAGFRFVGSSIRSTSVDAQANAVTFTLLGDEQFTYTVEAPAAVGSYTFSGVLRDQYKAERPVGGETSLRVGPAPTPAPTATTAATATPMPTATPTAVPTATPTPTPTATPVPTATATPVPTATAAATPTPEPTATPVSQPTTTPEPTATPEPVATPAPTATPVVVTETPEAGGGPPGLVWLILVVFGLGALLVVFVYIRSRR